MCDFFGGGSKASTSTTPTYTPPAQTTVSGPGAAAAPGVQVKGNARADNNNDDGMDTRAVRRGGSGGQVDGTASAKKRRSASAGLGL